MSELASVWPLFGLRIRTERLELRLPTEDDLVAMVALARAGIHDPDTMPFAVPWTRLESPEFERSFIQFHWRQRSAWTPDAWTLELVVLRDGQAVGSQGLSSHRFAVCKSVLSGSWLGRAHQGQGLGKEMRAAVLALAFDHLGAEVANTEAFPDNAASLGVSRALGYTENGIGRRPVEGRAQDVVRFRMTRDDWASRPRPPVTVEGLEPCRSLFAAP